MFLQLRIAVAFLGEREQSAWWDTAFLNSLGLRYLRLVFPKTDASAAVFAASHAACLVHDERIGKGGVAHLFRLPEDAETRLRRESVSLNETDLSEMCSKESAMRVLNSLAEKSTPAVGAGPVHVGNIKDVTCSAHLSRAAATYALAFRSGTHVFPYFS